MLNLKNLWSEESAGTKNAFKEAVRHFSTQKLKRFDQNSETAGKAKVLRPTAPTAGTGASWRGHQSFSEPTSGRPSADFSVCRKITLACLWQKVLFYFLMICPRCSEEAGPERHHFLLRLQSVPVGLRLRLVLALRRPVLLSGRRPAGSAAHAAPRRHHPPALLPRRQLPVHRGAQGQHFHASPWFPLWCLWSWRVRGGVCVLLAVAHLFSWAVHLRL